MTKRSGNLAAIRPRKADLTNWEPFDPGHELSLGGAAVRFDPESGAISEYTMKESDAVVADGDHLIGALRYQTFSAGDYERFLDQYILPSKQVKS